MDLGFGRLLEYVEEYFGKTISRILVGVIALAAFSVCIQLIWNNVVDPLNQLLRAMNLTALLDFVSTKLLPFVVALIAANLLASFSWSMVERVMLKDRMSKTATKVAAETVREASKEIEQLFSDVQVRSYALVNRLGEQLSLEAAEKHKTLRNELASELGNQFSDLEEREEKIKRIIDQLKELFAAMKDSPEKFDDFLREFIETQHTEER